MSHFANTAARAEQASAAAMQALRIKQRPKDGEQTIALPFGERVSAKPYQSYRFAFKNNWWLGRAIDLVLPEHRDPKYQLPDGSWSIGWPNSQEDGTTMQLAGCGFEPVRWKHIDKTLGARIRTHEGPNVREGEGFVYWRRLILVWVDPQLWEEEHIAPVIRSLSQLAHIDENFEQELEEKAIDVAGKGDILSGTVARESTEARVTRAAPKPRE